MNTQHGDNIKDKLDIDTHLLPLSHTKKSTYIYMFTDLLHRLLP